MTIIVQTIASASARDYDWLKSALAQWNGNRTDQGFSDRVPDFVMLAEKRLNADLEARAQEATVTLNVQAGDTALAIPADMAELKSLSLPGVGPLEYLPPDAFNAKAALARSSDPRFFTVIGQSMPLYPVPDKDASLTCAYRAYVPPLSDTAGVNWLVRDHPDVYLAAAMCEAIAYTKNWDDLPAWEKKYADAIESVNKPDWFSGAALTIRTA